jgi:hypothetical protein
MRRKRGGGGVWKNSNFTRMMEDDNVPVVVMDSTSASEMICH